MRWAHTLMCMRSRRWGREGSNGGFSQHSYTEAAPACTQTTLYYLHGGPLLALLVFCPAHTTPVTLCYIPTVPMLLQLLQPIFLLHMGFPVTAM